MILPEPTMRCEPIFAITVDTDEWFRSHAGRRFSRESTLRTVGEAITKILKAIF